MKTDVQIEKQSLDLAGERLHYILDIVGFKKGRGRVSGFHSYLKEVRPEEFGDLKYTAVRSWFKDASPPMRKIDIVMSALQENHDLSFNLSHVKTWWKLGGYFPFDEGHSSSPQNIEVDREKLSFYIISLIADEAGDTFQLLGGDELKEIKDLIVQFADDFRDISISQAPEKYLRIMIKSAIANSLKD